MPIHLTELNWATYVTGFGPSNAQYLVLSASGSLSAERVLALDNTYFSLTDGGANGNYSVSLVANAITNGKFRQSTALSIVGRSANSTGDVADISASAASDAVLRESGSAIGFGTIATGGIAASAVTYAKIQNVSATDKVLGRSTAGAGVIEEISTTGSGNVVRATSPTLVTPILGIPTSGTLTNCTGLPESGVVNLVSDLALKAPLASPTLTGTPAAPTAAVDTNTTQIATTGYVIAQAASATPLANGASAVGTSTRYARADHVHPTVDNGQVIIPTHWNGMGPRTGSGTLDASFMNTILYSPPFTHTVRYFVQYNAGANGAIHSQICIWGPVTNPTRGTPITPVGGLLLAKTASTNGGAGNSHSLLDLGARYTFNYGQSYFISYQTDSTAPNVYIVGAFMTTDTDASLQTPRWTSYGAGQPTYGTGFGTVGVTTFSNAWTLDTEWYYNVAFLGCY